MMRRWFALLALSSVSLLACASENGASQDGGVDSPSDIHPAVRIAELQPIASDAGTITRARDVILPTPADMEQTTNVPTYPLPTTQQAQELVSADHPREGLNHYQRVCNVVRFSPDAVVLLEWREWFDPNNPLHIAAFREWTRNTMERPSITLASEFIRPDGSRTCENGLRVPRLLEVRARYGEFSPRGEAIRATTDEEGNDLPRAQLPSIFQDPPHTSVCNANYIVLAARFPAHLLCTLPRNARPDLKYALHGSLYYASNGWAYRP